MMRFRHQLLIAMSVGALALAQDNQPQQPDPNAEDAPSRAARLSYINGSVSFQPGSVEDWVAATLNRPLTIGDRLWTEPEARAEISLGTAAVRIGPRTGFSFLNLDDQTTQIQLSTGTMSVRLRNLADGEIFEIDTPQIAFSLTRPGEYRIDVNEQGDATIVTVRGGSGDLTAGGQTFTVNPREQVRVAGVDQVAFDRRGMPPQDPFDNWCADRDRREDRSASATYVGRDVPGYADLDDNGVWSEAPDYGRVWVPRVDPGWAPYRYGHWAWIAPWGWTWVDDASWGYAPFHYGRWVFIGGRGWAWVPGPVVVGVRPVYSPALVAWVGGGGFSVAVGFGGGGVAVGWFPLGPREVFVPAYRYSPRYIERVNVTNTVIVDRTVFRSTTITNVTYVNRNVGGAVTVVNSTTLVGGRPVREGLVRVPPGAIARGDVVRVAAVAPERGAVLGGRAVVARTPPAVVVNRTVVARSAPPPRPVQFDRVQNELRANPGRPVDRRVESRIQSSQPQAQPAVRQMGPRGEQPRGEQPRGEQPRGEQPRGEQPRVDQRRPEQPRVEQPRPGQPQVDPRRVEQPRGEQPRVDQRRPEQPRVEQPRVEQPRPEQVRPPERRPEPQQRTTPPPAQPQRETPRAEQPRTEQPRQQERQQKQERSKPEKKSEQKSSEKEREKKQ
jgi:hypothetical protein